MKDRKKFYFRKGELTMKKGNVVVRGILLICLCTFTVGVIVFSNALFNAWDKYFDLKEKSILAIKQPEKKQTYVGALGADGFVEKEIKDFSYTIEEAMKETNKLRCTRGELAVWNGGETELTVRINTLKALAEGKWMVADLICIGKLPNFQDHETLDLLRDEGDYLVHLEYNGINKYLALELKME